MQISEWPSWAPNEALNAYHKCFAIGAGYQIEPLLRHDRAQELWSKLKKSHINYADFCNAVIDATTPPYTDKSPSEIKKHLLKIAKKARELAKLLDDVPELKYMFIAEYELNWFKHNPHAEKIKHGNDSWNSYYGSMPNAFDFQLRRFACFAEFHEQPFYEKPSIENADAIFFIKTMNQFFRAVSGRPHTSIIILCSEIFFPDYIIDKKHLEKLTKHK